MKHDSKYICQHLESRGAIVCNSQTKNNYWCGLKNISLNNIYCGICNCFKNVNEPEMEFSEITEHTVI